MKNGFITINLMPYREKQKSQAIKRFTVLLGAFAIGGLILTGIAHDVMDDFPLEIPYFYQYQNL